MLAAHFTKKQAFSNFEECTDKLLFILDYANVCVDTSYFIRCLFVLVGVYFPPSDYKDIEDT